MSDDAQRETYTHGYSEEFRQVMGTRTAAIDAAFFVPHLRPGMRVLDCGCGPGSITVDFAALVAPGEVVGLDIAEVQLARARELARNRGVSNVHFERGDIYELPFPAASFDAAFAHNVLEHLRDPFRAIKEMQRVLKPGGLVGILDNDGGTLIWEPLTPLRKRGLELFFQVAELNGASFFYSRHQRRLLREAGFVRTEGHAIVECFGTPEKTRWIAHNVLAQQFRDPQFAEAALGQGWVDRATLDAIAADAEAWGDDPDAYWMMVNPAAIGWVPPEAQ